MSKKVFFSVSALVLIAAIIYKISSVDNNIDSSRKTELNTPSKESKTPKNLTSDDEDESGEIGDTEVDQLNNESISDKEAQGIVKQVIRDFEEVSIPKEIPVEKEKAYGLLYNNYLKTSFFLHEIALGSIIAKREDLTKAFKLILMYDKDNDTSDVSDVLNIVEERSSKVFAESLKELSDAEEEGILRIKRTDVQVDP